jgi:ribosome maturation factor RimP
VQGEVGTVNGAVEGRVAELARAEASARGLAVLDVTVSEARPPVVTVTVDVDVPDHGRLPAGEAPAEPVDIDVIAELARALDAALVAGRVVPEDATLEVSSPGVERPLRSAEDLVRNLGRDVELDAGDEMFRGRLVAVEDGEAAVVAAGTEQRVALERVATARLVLPW